MKYFFALISFTVLSVSAFAEFTIDKDAAGQYVFKEDGKPVLQYNYETVQLPDGYLEKLQHGQIYAVPRSDYIHPLFDLEGEPITKDWAQDHAHHRGIYWAWPEVGYKDEFADLHALQNIFARPTGKINGEIKDEQCVLTAENVWNWKDSEPIVNEKVTITVSPKKDNGRYIDLQFEFTSLVDEVTLARRGTEFYGGLNIRMASLPEYESGFFADTPEPAETVKPTESVDTNVPVVSAKTSESSVKTSVTPNPAWVFAKWKNEKTQKKTEWTIFEKATNPDYPGQYVAYPEINWFQPTFPKAKTRFTLKKDETLTLNYRIWLHNGSSDDATKKSEWTKYQNK
ncbi:MAG: DUF6807 family protein [Thermoguttaceae bacterium]